FPRAEHVSREPARHGRRPARDVVLTRELELVLAALDSNGMKAGVAKALLEPLRVGEVLPPGHDLPVGVVDELLPYDLVGELAPRLRELVLARGPRRQRQSPSGLEDSDHVEQRRAVVG